MTPVPAHLDPLPKIDQRAGADCAYPGGV